MLISTAAVSSAQETAASSPAAGRGLSVVIAEPVHDYLADLAVTSSLETVRCLIGVLVGDTVMVELAWEPTIHERTPTAVRYGGCPRATVAKWHNHPPSAGAAPMQDCYLSEIDIRDALVTGAPVLQFVQVDADVMCWWHVSQLRAARAPGPLAAFSGQITATGLESADHLPRATGASAAATRPP